MRERQELLLIHANVTFTEQEKGIRDRVRVIGARLLGNGGRRTDKKRKKHRTNERTNEGNNNEKEVDVNAGRIPVAAAAAVACRKDLV